MCCVCVYTTQLRVCTDKAEGAAALALLIQSIGESPFESYSNKNNKLTI
jgi:hypothetical protein